MIEVKFTKQVTVDFVDNNLTDDNVTEKTFYRDQIVGIDHLEEPYNGFVDLIFEDGSAAVGIDKRGLTILY